jgi:hypothetical protein
MRTLGPTPQVDLDRRSCTLRWLPDPGWQSRDWRPPGIRAHLLLVFGDGRRLGQSAGIALTGGLAEDGDRVVRTCVGLGSSVADRDVVAIGLFCQAFRVGYGSIGGWDAFGPERVITRAHGNVLRSLDGDPALALYKR